MSPSSVRTSGLTSTRVASSPVKTLYSLHEDGGDLVDELGGELRRDGDLARLGGVDAVERVDLDAGERLGLLDGEDLDLHAALDAGEREVGAVGPVEQHGEVELLGDAGAAGDHDALDDVALDVEAEDGLRGLVRLVGGLGDLDAAGLAAAADLHLRLDDDDAAELLSCGAHLLRRFRDDTRQNRDLVFFEQVSGLVLVKIHVGFRSAECIAGVRVGWRSRREGISMPREIWPVPLYFVAGGARARHRIAGLQLPGWAP